MLRRYPDPEDAHFDSCWRMTKGLSTDGREAFLVATPTGLEPAASAVTGRRANQLRYGAWMVRTSRRLRSHGMLTHERVRFRIRTPNGIRTRATAVKGRGPGPLDDGGPPSLEQVRDDGESVGGRDSSGVAEVVQGRVVDPEVVRDLGDHRDPDLLDQLLRRRAQPGERTAIDGDPVWLEEGVAAVPFRERDPVVQTQQAGLVSRRLRLDQHDDVVHQLG